MAFSIMHPWLFPAGMHTWGAGLVGGSFFEMSKNLNGRRCTPISGRSCRSLGLDCRLIDRDCVCGDFEFSLGNVLSDYFATDLRYGSTVRNSRHGFPGYCGFRGFCIGGQEFLGALSIRLELAEFGGAFVKQTMSLSAGAIHRFLDLLGIGVVGFHGVEDEARFIGKRDDNVGFHFAAAAQTPDGSPDFVYEIVFEDADRREVLPEFGVEFGVGCFFGRADEVVHREEAELEAVHGGSGFSGFGAGAGARLRVCDVCCDLGWR